MESNMEDDLINKVAAGLVGLHKVDETVEPAAAARVRRMAVEKATGANLAAVDDSTMDYSAIRNRNAENVIGSTRIPLGVVGPLTVNGEFAAGKFYVPMATTEGALIASVSRGSKAITASGGANARIIENGMSRAPVFV